MTKYQEHFNKIVQFTDLYCKLINCHLVDFITERLWEECVPDKLRVELEKNQLGDNRWTNSDSNPELNHFINLTRSLSLESCSTIASIKDLVDILPTNEVCINTKKEFMNSKKLHEVEALGNVIAAVATSTNSLVIDAGAGKAYLSTFLAEQHKIPVLAIDSSQLCHKGAICRQEKLQKKIKEPQALVRYVVEEINDETNYESIVKQNFCDWYLKKNLILTGLHTCGSLAHSILRAFLRTKDINFLCIVPCCYHLSTETLTEKSRFSKNARMLAQQSVERSSSNKTMSPSLFYRAVLQVILYTMGIRDARIGRGGPLNDFPSYAKWALSRIGIEAEKIPSTEELQNVFRSYAHLKNKFVTFQMLRIHVGPVLEGAIMLDKMLFLQNSKQCSKLAVLCLFDPVLSPRRYGIIAIK